VGVVLVFSGLSQGPMGYLFQAQTGVMGVMAMVGAEAVEGMTLAVPGLADLFDLSGKYKHVDY
jgi:hypothetical protein